MGCFFGELRRRHVYRRAAACAVATCALLQFICIARPAFAAKKDNSVVFAFDQTLQSADPYFNNQLIGSIVADAVWDTLIFRDPETGAFKAELATSWKWADDRTLELDLRHDVRFHNGASFDSDDVVYTLNFVSKPENKTVNLELVSWIDHVEKVGSYKVRIVAKQPFPAAIAYLASPSFAIHPHEYYAKFGPKGMNEKPVGSGPFRVVEHALGKYIRLERNPDYFKDSPKSQPKIGRLEIRFIPDAQTRVAETIAGSVDLIMRVAPDQAKQLLDVPSLQIVSRETMNFAYLQINTMKNTPVPQLRDVRVRQAIMHAIDRETMVKFLIGTGSRVLHAECYPSQFGCDDANVPRYPYDPRKARQLLAKAGYANGFDIDLYAYLNRNQAEAIIGYLGAVGIRAHLRFLQFPAMRSAIRSGKATLVLNDNGSSAIDDISASTSRFHEFSPDDMNRDADVRDLLVRGDSSIDPNVRKDAYAKALALIAERAYVLPLYAQPAYYLAAKDLVFKPYADNILRFWEMSYK
jgi:peptide/nickel transport system substrate-binding protein